MAEADFPTELGVFRIYGFEAPAGAGTDEAVVLKMGDLTGGQPPLVRIHSQCLTGDVFHSLRCDCRAQLDIALTSIAAEGRGLLIYELQEGRGIGAGPDGERNLGSAGREAHPLDASSARWRRRSASIT